MNELEQLEQKPYDERSALELHITGSRFRRAYMELAAAELAALRARVGVLQKRLDYIKANQTDSVAVRFALIASDEEIIAKELDGDE